MQQYKYYSMVVILAGFFSTKCMEREEYAETNRQELVIEHVAQATQPPSGTTIFDAARSGNESYIRWFIQEADISVNDPDDTGNLPIFYAISGHHLAAVRLFIDHGTDVVNARVDLGEGETSGGRFYETLLHTAVRAGIPSIVQLLISAGIHVDTPDREGRTPLYIAAEKGFLGVIQMLLLNRANFNAVTTTTFGFLGSEFSAGETPLHAAVRYKQLSVAQELLSRGANVNAQTVFGQTPLDYTGDDQLRNLLISYRAERGRSLWSCLLF